MISQKILPEQGILFLDLFENVRPNESYTTHAFKDKLQKNFFFEYCKTKITLSDDAINWTRIIFSNSMTFPRSNSLETIPLKPDEAQIKSLWLKSTLTPCLSKSRFLSYLVNNYLALLFIKTLTQFHGPFESSPPPRNNRFDDIFPCFFTLKTLSKKIHDFSIPVKFLFEARPSSSFWEIYPYHTMSLHFIEVPQFLYLAINFIPEMCSYFFCFATTELDQFEFEDLRFLVFETNPDLGFLRSFSPLDEALVPLHKKRKKITIAIHHSLFTFRFSLKNKSLLDELFTDISLCLKKVLFVHEVPAQALPEYPFRLEILSESSTSDSPLS
jgi:hypothetical protein